MSVKIISEIGINWNGDLDIAKSMILESKRSGVDYVKFQIFDEQVIKNYSEDLKKKLEPMILDYNSTETLIEYAHENDIKFGVSVMYPEVFLNILNNLCIKPDFIKIRHADSYNEEIARKAVKFCTEQKIPLLVSVSRPPSEFLLYNLYQTYRNHVFFLYCVPKYPPEINDINIHLIGNTNFFSGYSNHYPSIHLPVIAIVKGSNLNDFFVEVHVKYNRDNCYFTPIDEAVSLTFSQLSELCNLRDTINKLHQR